MACLALALQPLNGPDVLLQTREWFPPARASLASQNFRETRGDPTRGRSDLDDQQPLGLGPDPVSATSGQVVVGKESKYRVVYRLVNSVYVLGITTADQNVSSNVFECACTVNQAFSVLVAACKGIDVTADKLLRKYTEVYMALDVVLRGVSAARLATILSSLHGDGLAQILQSATDAENRARGAESWNQIKGHSLERVNHIEVLSNATFELPEETLAAGDEAAALLATPAQTTATVGVNFTAEKVEEKPLVNEDPFAASDAINKPEEFLTGGFKKDQDITKKDVTAELSELKIVPVTKPPEVTRVEGFEGDYGGLEYDPADGGFGDAFEGLTDAFGGGLDPSEFGATAEKLKKLDRGLAGLEELERGPNKSESKETKNNEKTEGDSEPGKGSQFVSTGPVVWLTEEISAEYKGSVLCRVGLQGVLNMKTIPSSARKEDTEFSFSLDGAAGVKRVMVKNSLVSKVGEAVYHVRSPPCEFPITLLKYALLPQYTPIPLRLRLVSRENPLAVSFMIQYVPNPYVRGILTDVTFIMSLPFAPSSLKMAPSGILDRTGKELRWNVPQILPQSIPQQLRVQLPLSTEDLPSLSNQENAKTSDTSRFTVMIPTSLLSEVQLLPCMGSLEARLEQRLEGLSGLPRQRNVFTVAEGFYR